MKHRNRANQINPIEAKNSQGQTERWELFKAESGVWTLRNPLRELIGSKWDPRTPSLPEQGGSDE